MSSNLDLVRSIFAPWERGDYSSTDWVDPEIEYVIVDGPSPGRWAGVAGMSEGFREVLNAWQNVRVEADEYRAVDDERVVVVMHRSGRGRTSGLEIEQMRTEGAVLFHVRSGKVTPLVLYWDSENAFADLGLTPEGDIP